MTRTRGVQKGQDTARWSCYCLRSQSTNATYVGKTCNIHRRLRQHNGELVGGAKYTRARRPWAHLFVVTGFRTETEALQFEWRWKRLRGRGLSGVKGRCHALSRLCHLEQWTKNAPLAKDVPLRIQCALSKDEYQRLAGCGDDAFGPYASFEFEVTDFNEFGLQGKSRVRESGVETYKVCRLKLSLCRDMSRMIYHYVKSTETQRCWVGP